MKSLSKSVYAFLFRVFLLYLLICVHLDKFGAQALDVIIRKYPDRLISIVDKSPALRGQAEHQRHQNVAADPGAFSKVCMPVSGFRAFRVGDID